MAKNNSTKHIRQLSWVQHKWHKDVTTDYICTRYYLSYYTIPHYLNLWIKQRDEKQWLRLFICAFLTSTCASCSTKNFSIPSHQKIKVHIQLLLILNFCDIQYIFKTIYSVREKRQVHGLCPGWIYRKWRFH